MPRYQEWADLKHELVPFRLGDQELLLLAAGEDLDGSHGDEAKPVLDLIIKRLREYRDEALARGR